MHVKKKTLNFDVKFRAIVEITVTFDKKKVCEISSSFTYQMISQSLQVIDTLN